MKTNLTDIEKDINRLIDEWQKLIDLPRDELTGKIVNFDNQYYSLYSEAIVFIKQIHQVIYEDFIAIHNKISENKKESESQYWHSQICELNKVEAEIQEQSDRVRIKYLYIRKEVLRGQITTKLVHYSTLIIQYLTQQKSILEGVKRRFTSSLFDIKHLAQADLFTDALDQARYLWNHKYYRAAGVVAGVVLEQHLKSICNSKGFVTKERHPSIDNYKQTLYDENKYITVEQSTILTHLGQLRNKCGHDKSVEPTKDDI